MKQWQNNDRPCWKCGNIVHHYAIWQSYYASNRLRKGARMVPAKHPTLKGKHWEWCKGAGSKS